MWRPSIPLPNRTWRRKQFWHRLTFPAVTRYKSASAPLQETGTPDISGEEMAIKPSDMEEMEQILDSLREARERSAGLRRRLPEVADAMLDLETPFTPEAELAVALEGLALDLAPLIERLEEAAA